MHYGIVFNHRLTYYKRMLCLKCRMDTAHLMSNYLIFSFIFIVQSVPHGLFTAYYSKPFLNTELLTSLGAFLQQSSLLYLGASQTWNNLFSQCLNEVRGYCTPTWTDGKQRYEDEVKTLPKIFECLGLDFFFWVHSTAEYFLYSEHRSYQFQF